MDDEKFMREAIKEAKKAAEISEVPVGAVIVFEEKIIARAHNQIEKLKDSTAHAEMIAITQATSFFNNWRLGKTSIYVTLEPCPMCLGAILLSRIDRLIYSLEDEKYEKIHPHYQQIPLYFKDRKLKITKGILTSECKELLALFFKSIRKSKNLYV